MQLTIFCLLLVAASSFSLNINKAAEAKPKMDDTYRPQLHFSVAENWLNDPNGLVYYGGEYHLYYQYSPSGTTPGPKYWAHSVSTDLVHWEDLPVAISPDPFGDIWSGSAVVDFKNSSGFQTKETVSVIVAIFTQSSDFQKQSIAYSNDKGRTFTMFEGNPVVPNTELRDFRDPKVFQMDDTWFWVLSAGNRVMFYKSEDLKSWTYLSDFGADQGSHYGVWECPELLRLKGDDGQDHWVLLVSVSGGSPNGGSGTQYFIGDFDGTNFLSSQTEARWMDWGPDNYAGVTFFNEPKSRSILIGWMTNLAYAESLPTIGWRGLMTLPRQLSVTTLNSKLTLKSEFIEELLLLEIPEESFEVVNTNIAVDGILNLTDNLNWVNPLLKLDLSFDITNFGRDSSIAICFLNSLGQDVCTGFDNYAEKVIFFDRSRSGNIGFNGNFMLRPVGDRVSESNIIRFEIYLDVSAFEMFVDSGLTAMTGLFYPDEPFTKVEIRHHVPDQVESELILVAGSIQGLKTFKQ